MTALDSAGRRAATVLSLVLSCGTVACVTGAPAARVAGPRAQTIDGVPAERYKARSCAAGALAAVLRYWGQTVDVDELDQRLAKVRHGGVLTVDLLIEARARGFKAELLEGSPEVVGQSIADHVPLILLVRVLNAPRDRSDLHHYIVADGYDPDLGLVRLQFGDGIKRWAELERLDRSWAPTGRVVLRVQPETSPPDSAAARNGEHRPL